MLRLIFLLPLFAMFGQTPWGLTKIGNGTISHYRIDKVFVNPNSNPNQIFTNFNLPDSLEASIIITNNKLDTMFVKKNIVLVPGEYQFFLNYNKYPNMKPGLYMIHFEFHNRSKELIYYSSIRAVFL